MHLKGQGTIGKLNINPLMPKVQKIKIRQLALTDF